MGRAPCRRGWRSSGAHEGESRAIRRLILVPRQKEGDMRPIRDACLALSKGGNTRPIRDACLLPGERGRETRPIRDACLLLPFRRGDTRPTRDAYGGHVWSGGPSAQSFETHGACPPPTPPHPWLSFGIPAAAEQAAGRLRSTRARRRRSKVDLRLRAASHTRGAGVYVVRAFGCRSMPPSFIT